jgi:hypothetical protein
MTWYRVNNKIEDTTALVDADSVEQAVEIYNEIYPPDLDVEEATTAEIKQWHNSDQQPYRT